MPTYTYYCCKCKKDFELFFSIKDYIDNPKCCLCDSSQKVHRQYIKDISTQSTSIKKNDSELKTLGDLANRNRDKMSKDEKNSLHTKHNAYKEQKPDNPLPKGMSRMPKGKKIKWT